MNKNSQIGYIMGILNISGIQLSKAINVDRTLISKWKNNVRPLNSSSLHFMNIINRIISFNEEQKASTLERFFDKIYPYIDKNEPDYLVTCLSTWLAGDDLGQFNNVEGAHIDKNALYSTSIGIYQGDEGKRKAVLRVLDYALALPPGQEIYLSDMEDLAWLIEDDEYNKLASDKILQILKKGHNITVIHNLDRKPSEISDMMFNWMPLYLTGKLTSYYINDCNVCEISPTIFMIHNHMALMSLSTNERDAKDKYVTIYRDPFSIKQMYNIFTRRLRKSKTLITSFHIQSLGIKGFMDDVMSYGTGEDDTYFTSPMPLYITMDKDTLIQILNENNVPKPNFDYVVDIYEKTRSFFRKDLDFKFFRQFLDIDKVEAALSQDNVFSFELSAFSYQKINVSNVLFREHIKSTIELLKELDSYEMKLVSTDSPTRFIEVGAWVKKNCFIYSYPQTGAQSIILSDEDMIVDLFYEKLDEQWNSNKTTTNDAIKELSNLT